MGPKVSHFFNWNDVALRANRFILPILAGLGAGLAFFILAAVVEVIFTHERNLFSELFHPLLPHLLIRLIVIFGCLVFTTMYMQLRKSEQETRRSLQRLARSQILAHVGDFERELSTNSLIWSDEMYRLVGLEPGDPKGTYVNFLAMVDPEGRELVRKLTAEAIHEGKPYAIEYRLHRETDGADLVIRATGDVVRDQNGKPVRLVGTAQDITELKRAEELLFEKERQFRATFELSPVGICQADPQTGRFVLVNDRLCEITGYSREELLSISFREITLPADREANWKAFQQMLSGELPEYDTEKRYIRKDGRIIWVHVSARVIRAPNDKVVRTVAILQDITDRMRFEEDLAKARDEAEKALLSRDELIKELQAINTGLSRFASTTSHELKNPLSALIGYADILRESYSIALDDKGRDFLKKIETNAKYLNHCLDDLRQFGSLGLTPMDSEPVSLSSLIIEVGQLLGIDPQDGYIHFAKELPQIICNRQLMLQVFRNLIDNAVKYGMGKEKGIFIEATIKSENGGEIVVRDRGPGIPQEIQSTIFEPFVSTGRSTGIGTGLGLAIVKKIIEAHKGTIDCRSSSDGSAFVIKLPN